MPNPISLHLMGELDLIRELGEICHSKNIPFTCSINNFDGITSLPDYCLNVPKIPTQSSIAIELTNTELEHKKANLSLLEQTISQSSLILSSSITVSLSEQSQWMKYPNRLVGCSSFPTLLSQKLIELTGTVETESSYVLKAKDFFLLLEKETIIIQDRVGMVTPRILCMLINEAFFSIMEDIADAKDIDLAMKLGTNYPNGPIEWGEKIGFNQVVAVLKALQEDTGEERYRIAPLLKQMNYRNS